MYFSIIIKCFLLLEKNILVLAINGGEEGISILSAKIIDPPPLKEVLHCELVWVEDKSENI